VPPRSQLLSNYYNSLSKLNQIRIPRNFNPHNKGSFVIHGFGVASEKAYGACIYCVYETEQGQQKSVLVCSKAKVAPLKVLSLPKLELCAALILARLVAAMKDALKRPIKNMHLWNDSTIVLSWIDTAPHKLHTYYANRVTEIHNLVPEAKWHHVPSQNPADVLSRGTIVEELIVDELWWHGPSWLPHKEQWPEAVAHNRSSTSIIGMREEVMLMASTFQQDLLRRYSSFNKFKRHIVYELKITCKNDADLYPWHLKKLTRRNQSLTVWSNQKVFRTSKRI